MALILLLSSLLLLLNIALFHQYQLTIFSPLPIDIYTVYRVYRDVRAQRAKQLEAGVS